MKILILVLVVLMSMCAVAQDVQLPDAPSTVAQETQLWSYAQDNLAAPVVKAPRFWSVGRWDAPKPLRTKRQTLASWQFWSGEVAMWGTTFANVEVTRNERQNPPIPKHGDLYVDAYVPMLALSGAHYLLDRYVSRGVGMLMVGFATGWHGYEAVKGYYP